MTSSSLDDYLTLLLILLWILKHTEIMFILYWLGNVKVYFFHVKSTKRCILADKLLFQPKYRDHFSYFLISLDSKEAFIRGSLFDFSKNGFASNTSSSGHDHHQHHLLGILIEGNESIHSQAWLPGDMWESCHCLSIWYWRRLLPWQTFWDHMQQLLQSSPCSPPRPEKRSWSFGYVSGTCENQRLDFASLLCQ